MDKPSSDQPFTFEISLSVLNHLGRNLYRNYITVLGEAISNAWDADASNVWIEVSDDKTAFVIKDDGIGMNSQDFQSKFLKIGYSKRSQGRTKTQCDRPYIGAKGIGKLALLSVSNQLTVLSRKKGESFTGGTINNHSLDEAITQDVTPQNYPLELLEAEVIDRYSDENDRGTILVFQDTKERIRHSPSHLRKLLALSFKFSLLDSNFRIFVNDEQVSDDDLKLLNENTEFLWVINQHKDSYIQQLNSLKRPKIELSTPHEITGFLGTVNVPSSLNIVGTGDRVSVDLLVNGRVRERNILRRVPTQRVVESYIYGQIHFNAMDQGLRDPFTSSREGVLEDDENFSSLLDYLERDLLPTVLKVWDKFRRERGQPGNEEDTSLSRKQRAVKSAVIATLNEYSRDEDEKNNPEIIQWQTDIRTEGEFNMQSYLHCFVAENLLRSFIEEHQLSVFQNLQNKADEYEKKEAKNLQQANISYAIRKLNRKSERLDMEDLVSIAEQTTSIPQNRKKQSMHFDALTYRPLRNVVCHTGLLTDEAKEQLGLVVKNLGERLNLLIRSRKRKSECSEQD